ncbi:hypothetical protein FNF29_04052 [Cafeteria roenbergensis]|uniref:EF-hand domain-containing protein n=1 Tax=Cafeteria roenbergensis TaxID=33653 RepID=A0A5A8CGS7_CAFRO|nr:hypothetical protein FNF29_04052 [Cafeteria roenbergensis]|eukprot:KAA0152186.1 hypothetical protein FNF29_04052 [Cafeteria roenbergensis]
MAFNTGGRPRTLVGNWQEDRVLHTLGGDDALATGGANVKRLVTKDRVLPTGGAPMEIQSTSRDAQDYSRHMRTFGDKPVGPRERRAMEAAMREASDTVTRSFDREAARGRDDRYLSSSARSDFAAFGADAYKQERGRRVMKTSDGVPIPPGSRDVELLAAAGLAKPRANITEDEVEAALPAGGLAAPPITMYSQRAAEGAFPMTSATGSNPHARSNKFSAPIEEGVPEHEGGMDHSLQRRAPRRAGLLRMGAGSELSVREAMRSLRERLAARFGPSGVLRVQASFAAMDSSGDGALSQEELATGLRRLGFPMPGRELAQLFSWFDADRSGALAGGEATALPLGDVVGAMRAGAHPSVAAGRMDADAARREAAKALDIEGTMTAEGAVGDGQVTWLEFSGYHRSLSACMDDDAAFEAGVRGMWGVSASRRASPGAGAAAGPSAGGPVRRVDVTHDDGTTEVVEIEDRIGLTHADEAAIRARLRRHGVTRVHSVRLLD